MDKISRLRPRRRESPHSPAFFGGSIAIRLRQRYAVFAPTPGRRYDWHVMDLDQGAESVAERLQLSTAAAYRQRALWIARHILPHEPELRRALLRRAPGGFDIDDIVQEIYARLAGMSTVDHIHSPRSYMFRMATGVMTDYVRHQKVVPIHAVEDIDAAGATSQDPSPETVVVARDQLNLLARLFARLPTRVAEVVTLRRVEGLSQREVSRRLGIPESTVEKRMARGLYLLAQLWETGGNEAPRPTPSASRDTSK